MNYRIVFVMLLIDFGNAISAQQQNPFMNDANGRPMFWGSQYVADGSPYLREEYNWAEVTTVEGKVYRDIRIKFNLMDRVVQYLGDDGKEMIATLPVKSIKFPVIPAESGTISIMLSSVNGALNTPDAAIYEVLDSGKVTLLKKISVTYRDEKKYSEAVITRHFDRQETYYILTPDGQLNKLEKNRSFITSMLLDKKTEVEQYIDSNKLKCKTLKDLQMIVEYYNSLFQ